MPVIQEEIEVEAPLRAVYDQWTQFEEFPTFFEGVDEVRQIDETTLHWVTTVAGARREWDARITQQIPDQLIAWTSTGRDRNDGLVTFDALGATRTRVTLRLDMQPDGAVEAVGTALGLFRLRARGDLRRFKDFIEDRILPTGAWRNEVREGVVLDEDQLPVGPEPADERSVRSPGPVPADTGGMIDLDRVLGTIPVVLVFLEPLDSESSRMVLSSLGERLVDFGRDRVQVLAVAAVDPDMAADITDGIDGHVRVLADPDRELADRFGARPGPDRPVTVLVDAQGRREAMWEEDPGADVAESLMLRLGQLSAQ